MAVDTGFVDTDSKWRQAVGEITADYQDVLFKKGFGGIKKEAEAYVAELDATSLEGAEKMEFYRSIVLVCDGIIRLANRYAEKAREMAAEEADETRKAELMQIAEICDVVPENPPKSFREAMQFMWFTQLGGILSENPLAWNPGRFDQYMYCLLYTSSRGIWLTYGLCSFLPTRPEWMYTCLLYTSGSIGEII